MPGSRDDVGSALDRATDLAGADVLRQPRRLRAILTDLVGQPGAEHRAEVEAVVAAATLWEGGRPRDDDAAVAALGRNGVNPALARWALATVGEHGVGTSAPATRPPVRSRRWVQISLACVVLAIPVALLLWPDPDPDDDDATSTVTASEPTPTGSEPPPSPTPPPDEVTAWRIEFDDATEGGFDVSRTWQLSEGRLTATVTLTPLAASGTIQHRELVPAEAFADPVFSPEPDNRTGDVAVFNVDASSGDTATVTIEADLAAGEPDEAQVQSWIAHWRERVVELRPLDDDPPATATITPLT